MTAETVEQWLKKASERLSVSSETAHLDAQVLLRTVLYNPSPVTVAFTSKTLLYRHHLKKLEDLLIRRIRGEPIAYLLGTKEFWSLPLRVTPNTLIPRPETELLVEQGLRLIELGANTKVLDLGTGCGAVALAIAKERPAAQITATDISIDALSVANFNANMHGLQNIRFFASDWLEAVGGKSYSLITCNPPYVGLNDPCLDQFNTQYEPELALISGQDGMDDLKTIIPAARQALTRGGWLIVEHAHHQVLAVKKLLSLFQ